MLRQLHTRGMPQCVAQGAPPTCSPRTKPHPVLYQHVLEGVIVRPVCPARMYKELKGCSAFMVVPTLSNARM